MQPNESTPLIPSSQEKAHDDPAFERFVASNGTGPLSTQPEENPDALLDGYAATDTGNGHRLAAHHGSLIRYVAEWGYLVWSGSRWRKDDTEAMIRFGKDVCRTMIVEAGTHLKDWATDKKEIERGKKLLKHAEASQSMGRLKAMVENVRSEHGIVMRATEFDVDALLLNCDNATVDLRTGEAKPHEMSDYITKKVPVAYDPDATAPTWERFLADVFGDPALIAYIQRVIGYCLTGDTREQCVFIFYGTGSNGKSTLLQTVLRILGNDYATQLNSSTITQHKDGGANNDVAALQGIRFVSCIEVGDGKKLNEELVKQFTGQDRIRARFLYKESFEFEPQFKLLIAANHKPEVRGQDTGMWRRVRLIPFTRTFTEEKKDPLLPGKLLAESKGILAWMVRGAKEWLEKGLVTPDVVRAATLAYKEEMNELGEFLETFTWRGAGLTCAAGTLYGMYRELVESRHDRPMSQQAFGRRMHDLGFEAGKERGVRVWHGLSTEPQARTLSTFGEDRPI